MNDTHYDISRYLDIQGVNAVAWCTGGQSLSFLRDISPITHVDRITAPLMVIQGANDPRVPQSESDQMVAAIRSRGGIVDYMLFDDEGHGISKLDNKLKVYRAMAAFLEKHV